MKSVIVSVLPHPLNISQLWWLFSSKANTPQRFFVCCVLFVLFCCLFVLFVGFYVLFVFVCCFLCFVCIVCVVWIVSFCSLLWCFVCFVCFVVVRACCLFVLLVCVFVFCFCVVLCCFVSFCIVLFVLFSQTICDLLMGLLSTEAIANDTCAVRSIVSCSSSLLMTLPSKCLLTIHLIVEKIMNYFIMLIVYCVLCVLCVLCALWLYCVLCVLRVKLLIIQTMLTSLQQPVQSCHPNATRVRNWYESSQGLVRTSTGSQFTRSTVRWVCKDLIHNTHNSTQ